MRWAEIVLFLAPAGLFLLWRAAARRGVDGIPPRQLVAILAALLLFGATLATIAVRTRLPPGRYIPAQSQNGQIIPGHSE